MAKFKIEVELNYVDYENGTIDENVFNRIVNEIVRKMSEDNEKSIIHAVSEELAKKVNTLLDEILCSFMEREIMVTDSWGDPVEKHGSVKDLLKAKFDDFLLEKVDKNGKSIKKSECSYGTTLTRLEYKLENMVKSSVDTFVNNMQRQTERDIQGVLNEKTKKMVNDSISKKISENLDIFELKKG